MRRHDQKAKYFRFADRVSASTTRGVRSLAERRNDPGGFHRPKKTTKLFDVAQIPSTRAPYIFFLPTNVFTIKESKWRSRSSLDRVMNRNDPLAFDRRDLYCLTQKVMDLKPLEKPFGMICVSRGTWMCNGPKFTTVVWQNSCNCNSLWRPQSSLDY